MRPMSTFFNIQLSNTRLTREKETKLDLMTKEQAAHRILDAIHYELAK